MNADRKVPVKTMANGAFLAVPDADPEMVPDSFSISWHYDNFLMTFANGQAYTDNPIENWGVFFVGNRASLQVNRQGYALRPVVPPVRNKVGPPPPPTAGGVTLGAGGAAIAPGGPGGGRGGPGGGRGGNLPPVEAKLYVNPKGGVEEDYPLDVHTRNFLDCIKSRQKPNAEFEIGYYAALPCLLALESLQKGKPLGWDAEARVSSAVGKSVPRMPRLPAGSPAHMERYERLPGDHDAVEISWPLGLLFVFCVKASMKPELRVALLGQGFMGKAHSNAYCQAGHFYDLPYRIRRTLLCGRDPASLAAMADRWGWEGTSTDWRAAIDRPDIDIVDIALPNHLHAPAAIAAAEAGKIVFCEKPLALSAEEGRAMVAAARGRPTLVWFNYRRVPAIALCAPADCRRPARSDLSTTTRRTVSSGDRTRPGTATWKMDPAQAGSGVADDLLTHLLDTALYLNGRITSGIADARTIVPNRRIDDAVMALVKFENGSAGTFEATRFAIGCKNQNAFQIHGAGGHAAVQPRAAESSGVRRRHRTFDRTGTTRSPRHRSETSDFREFLAPGPHHRIRAHVHRDALAEFLDCLARESDFHPSFEDALVTQQVLDGSCNPRRRGSGSISA